jgi:hypothetical protein
MKNKTPGILKQLQVTYLFKILDMHYFTKDFSVILIVVAQIRGPSRESNRGLTLRQAGALNNLATIHPLISYALL